MRALAALSLLTSACATVPSGRPGDVIAVDEPPVVRPAPPASPAPPLVTPGMQWLYGAGEGAASSIQVYRAVRLHVLAARRKRPRDSVILADGVDPRTPTFVPCGRKPLAVVLDVDETVIQNLGYEYALAKSGKATDGAALNRWQSAPRTQVRAMPGAAETLNELHSKGVAIIYNTNRDDEDAAATAGSIVNAGLPAGIIKQTLFHRGDVDGQGGKDGRRTYIAQRYCVVAMVGDQLGDFSDAFNRRDIAVQERRELAGTGQVAGMWGDGWFLLSNPAYGPGLRGGIDELYPPAVRWSDPGEIKP